MLYPVEESNPCLQIRILLSFLLNERGIKISGEAKPDFEIYLAILSVQ